ncbi:unnamed protein product [Miscanthus lutarioriparius]|uniref:DUF6598 domain-containing protein n=1 Tax=Miscanthus lutarioriparius TaxID=422564 RepID=A0A811RBD7_9POAL|nr:unnamed protein product [Miscanthus lutarioriparius]
MESEIKPMATEGGGLTATPVAERGRKRSPSPLTLSDDEDLSDPTHGYGEWLLSDSDEDEDQEDKGIYRPFTIDDIPRPSCDHKQQTDVLHKNPETKVRGPLPLRLFPAFKSGKHIFGSEYNLADKSQISLDSVGDCPNECWCYPMGVLQFVDIKIAGYRHTHPGQVKIYGFIAAREPENPLRNYVYCREIENCESVPVKQKTESVGVSIRTGSCKCRQRLYICYTYLSSEFNVIDNFFESKSFIDYRRFYGERCALDIKYIVMINAVEALVEVTALRLDTIPGGVNMKLYAKTSGFNDVIPLFQGIAPEPGGGMMRFAVGVERHNRLDLCVGGSRSDDATLCGPCAGNAVSSLATMGRMKKLLTWGCLQHFQPRSPGDCTTKKPC